jgi:two-component system, NarL family, sensor histidine kinase DesK
VTPDVPEPEARSAADVEVELRRTRWASGWRRVVFPGIFLVFLAQTAHGIEAHAEGAAAVVGYLVLVAFAVAYVRALWAMFAGATQTFWLWFGVMVVLLFAELPIAHQDAFVMVTYIVVLSLAVLGRRAAPIVVALVLLALFLPPLVPSWHTGVDVDAAMTTALVAVAMYGFFEVIRSNRALTEARAEVAGLAAEAERARIARDLHDLLGHSLTTITVKAGLARRLSAVDPERAAREIAEVEELARRSLADVRTAVTGYREVSLTGELASGRELLRVVGIEADLPGSTDVVRSDLHELFGWVVREGLTNVVRHAQAGRCTVTLSRDAVEIVDDGMASARVGAAAGGLDGSGLRGLRERVAAACGTVEAGPVGTAVHGGWRLRVEVPGAGAAPGAAGGPGEPARPTRRSA